MLQHTLKSNIGLEVEVTSFRKDKGKPYFRWSGFMIDYISAYKSQIVFIGLDLEADKPSMNAE